MPRQITLVKVSRNDRFSVIARSRVGTYHVTGGGSANCSSRIRVVLAHFNNIKAAGNHAFCETCFPNGKPSEVFVDGEAVKLG